MAFAVENDFDKIIINRAETVMIDYFLFNSNVV